MPENLDHVPDREDGPSPSGRPGRRSNTLVLGLTAVGALLLGAVGVGAYALFRVRAAVEARQEAAVEQQSANNLKRIGKAIQNYNDTFGALPVDTYTSDGKPLLSWRVYLLAFLEEEKLHFQVNWNEPWDGPTNRALLDRMPAVYVHPAVGPASGFTHYRGFSNPEAIFGFRGTRAANRKPSDPQPWPFGISQGQVADGTACTLTVIEAADPGEWTKPDDLDASPGKPLPRVGVGRSGARFQACLLHGTVVSLRRDLPESTLRALITHDGKERLPPDWDK